MAAKNGTGVDKAFQNLAVPIFSNFHGEIDVQSAKPAIVTWNTNRNTSSRAAVYDITLEYQKGQQRLREHFILKTPIETSYGNGSMALYNAETAKKAVEMAALTKDIEFAPQVCRIPKTNAVVMKRIEDDEGKPAVTLDSLLETAETRQARKSILDDYFRTLAYYEVRATIAHRKLVESSRKQDRTWLWQGGQFPGIDVKLRHYFLGTKGIKEKDADPEVLKRIIECASPIILRHEHPCSLEKLHFEVPFICHGDGCTSNALYIEKTKKWYIIDPRFRLGHPLSDFAAIASCPGLTSYNGFDSRQRFAVSEWLDQSKEYMLLFNEVYAASRGIRKVGGTGFTLGFTLGRKERFEIAEETIPSLKGLFLSEFFLYSFRNQAVNNTIEREDKTRYKEMNDNWLSFKYSRECHEMQKSIKTAVYVLSQMPKEYGFSSEEANKIGELTRILEEHKVIDIPGNPR